ncbi:MAG: sensor histidine kinase [Armatimonadota bacterium]|nr:MAG: sensor histidine kinase [Armatimonadota bacterium]
MATRETRHNIETAAATGLSLSDRRLLERAASDLKVAADLAHADLLILCPTEKPGQLVVVAHGRPSTAHSLYPRSRSGDLVGAERNSPVWRSLKRGRPARGAEGLLVGGVPVEERVTPMRNREGHLIALLDMHRSAYYRRTARRRDDVLREAAAILSTMLFADTIDPTSMEKLIHAGDGIVVYDAAGRITYADARARAIYRKLELRKVLGEQLDERRLPGAVVLKRHQFRIHSELEIQVRDSVIIKRVIPLSPAGRNRGQVAVICDVTDLRRRERQRLVKAAVVQEIHHRVKNNLQTIASLLRLQVRRATSELTKRALRESVNRILSIATVHDFLSREGTEAVDVKELGESLLHSALNSNAVAHVEVRASGPHVLIRADQATPLALAVNELALNAVEHAFRGRDSGEVAIDVRRDGGDLVVEVRDNGVGLPADFSLDSSANLGLQIVQTLVTQDLRGRFAVGSEGGTWARISVPMPKAESEDA